MYATIIIAIVAIGAVLYAYTQTRYEQNYQKALSAEQADICATPPGYTDEQWYDHMSHHPDRYAQCLK